MYASPQVALLWAAHANTAPACFWTLALLFSDAAALARVTEEVRGAPGGSAEPLPLLQSATWLKDSMQ